MSSSGLTRCAIGRPAGPRAHSHRYLRAGGDGGGHGSIGPREVAISQLGRCLRTIRWTLCSHRPHRAYARSPSLPVGRSAGPGCYFQQRCEGGGPLTWSQDWRLRERQRRRRPCAESGVLRAAGADGWLPFPTTPSARQCAPSVTETRVYVRGRALCYKLLVGAIARRVFDPDPN
jgi:hypothetical protein